MHQEYTEEIERWLWDATHCWRCGRAGLWPQTLCAHHFVRGSNRKQNERCTMIVLCYECHNEEHNGESLGLVRCLALKKAFDRDWYDVDRVCMLRGMAIGAVTEEEVDEAMRLIQEEDLR